MLDGRARAERSFIFFFLPSMSGKKIEKESRVGKKIQKVQEVQVSRYRRYRRYRGDGKDAIA